ncbi:uncharacterized protein LOC111905170 [Lactuca sativa]|uniref:Uncharacterized protein n=1 Tax=Lactuca sativa TaxID=4236 RepID=A0A9R1WU85_LACSA|nr:uncharacterized protein LOC111905170 [Lactuca sativa]KAJ0187806.1 hypothetical protein LSAT_V11C900488630 [Lactuca sativa]
MRSKATSQRKPITIVWIIKTPIRALCKAKDIYIKGITNFSNTYSRPVMILEEANRTTMQLPRSFSTTMLPDDHSRHQQPEELVRANSTSNTHISMADLERYMIHKQNHRLQPCASRKGVPRSCSVGMGRIDEDRASSFRDDCVLLKNKVVVKVKNSRLSSNCS